MYHFQPVNQFHLEMERFVMLWELDELLSLLL